MTEEISIPAWCFVPKPYFKSRPDAATIKQIKDFIKAGGKPHLWPGHTHTKPTRGSPIEYLDEYDLPKSCHKNESEWAPCPCCSPKRPKYYKGGKIGWFPEEGIIRNMGPDCFQAFDKEGHLQAVAKLRKEQKLSKDIAYLLSNLPKAPTALRTLEHALPTVEAVDALRKALRHGLPVALRKDLWPYIKDGVLRTVKKKTETYETEDGKKEKRVIETNVDYATIDGYRMLDPNEPELTTGLKNIIQGLRSIEPGHDPKSTIAAMPEEERTRVARMLGRSLNRAKEIFKEVDDIRPFVSVITIATLRNWGKHKDCPIHCHAMVDDSNVYFGRTEHEHRRFELPPEFFSKLGGIPSIADIDLAA